MEVIKYNSCSMKPSDDVSISNVGYICPRHFTPLGMIRDLMYAVSQNRVDIIQMLWPKVWKNEYGWLDYQLLYIAIRMGHLETTHLLLNKGARVFKRANCNTPLHIASSLDYEWLEVVRDLLIRGARVDHLNEKGESPLHFAYKSFPYSEKIELLLEFHLITSTKNLVNKEGLSFLHIACCTTKIELVKTLVQSNPNTINCRILPRGTTALFFTVDQCDFEMTRYLLENGADPYIPDGELTTLHLALEMRSVSMIDLLLKYDTRHINLVNKYNVSHFMVACASSETIYAKKYLERHDPASDQMTFTLVDFAVEGLKKIDGYTALHFATDLGHIEMVEFLLDRGANCCSAGVSGISPHVIAQRRKHVKIFQLLQKHCDLVKYCKETCALNPDFESYNEFVKRYTILERVRELKSTYNAMGRH